MAIAIVHNLGGATTEQYDESIKRLDEANAFPSPGQLYHVCFGESGSLRVVDVYESQEAFDKFGETLIPILNDIGINLSESDVSEVHNINS
jgi:hypothetical protein